MVTLAGSEAWFLTYYVPIVVSMKPIQRHAWNKYTSIILYPNGLSKISINFLAFYLDGPWR
jgi:hypothetical protein